MTPMNIQELYDAQEIAFKRVIDVLGDLSSTLKLCGGTPLARCYLHHRISYDLDFFLPYRNSLHSIGKRLVTADIGFITEQSVIDKSIYSQLFGHIAVTPELNIEVAFIEDRWFDSFSSVQQKMGNSTITTESVEGLYHRKLRTVSGFEDSEFPVGGRQTARDIFDLYVLSRMVKPIHKFINDLEVPFPEEAFYNGLANMDWLKLAKEINAMHVAPEWKEMLNFENLIPGILTEAGMTTVFDDAEDEDDDSSGPGF